MVKFEKIEQETLRIREKIAQLQNKLKELDEQRVEQENLQIVQAVRALKLSRDELAAFLAMGKLPASEQAAIPKQRYSKPGNGSEDNIYEE